MTAETNKDQPRTGKSKALKIGALTLAVLIVGAVAARQTIQGTTTSVELADGVYQINTTSLLFRDGSNSLAVKTHSGILLVDTQLSIWTPKVIDTAQDLFGLPISQVVNTHWHPDHSGGNDQLTPTAEIWAHENVRNLLSIPHEGFGLTGPGSYGNYDAVDTAGLPERTYRGSLQLPQLASGGSIEAVHYPNAHTDGDTVVYFDSGKVVAVGDIVWPGGFPFVDIHNGGNAVGILVAIDDIVERTRSESVIVAGHREPMTQTALLEYREMVSNTIDLVRQARGSGKSLDRIVADGLPAEYGPYASSVVPTGTWIKMIFHSLDR